MSSPKRNRARILTASGLKKLREQIRSHEVEENASFKYTLERLGELTGLDPETVKNVLDCKGSDKRTIARCFDYFGLTLEDSDHIPAAQVSAAPPDPGFVGRDEAIADLNVLVSRNTKVIVIQARGGVGKTTLARKYLQQEFGSFLEFPIAKETKDIASIEGLIEEKLRQLGEEPGREFLVSLDRLKRKLQAERIGILIDNLEPALDAAGKFIEPHRRYVELLRVLSDPTVKSITLITSRERLREVDATVQHYGLRSLDMKAWEQFFQGRGINAETSALAALHNAYGGNAKAMDIVSSAVLEDFTGDVEAYWQANQDDLFIERDLEDLVTKQFDRLQQLDPDAYKLLCRMGCYRYQDVPTVPIEGLFCLLWDVSENRYRRVIKSLQDRSLIDFEDGKYWLHPVIRAEAISRLRISEYWVMSNQKIAQFWTDTVKKISTVEDAITALEAYFHHIEYDDFEQACNVILTRRDLEEYSYSPRLGSSFYRIGLSQKMIAAITQIIGKIEPGYSLGKLYNLLGDQYWAIGRLNQAIACHQESMGIAEHCLTHNGKGMFIPLNKQDRLDVLALFNIALCKIDLWELEEAKELFENYIFQFRDDYNLDSSSLMVSYAWLAFISSLTEDAENTVRYIEKSCQIYRKFTALYKPWGLINGLLTLGLTYKNLGEFDKSCNAHQKVIIWSDQRGFTQVKARAISGIAEVYREKQIFDKALSSHIEAIEMLDRLGAKCHLAEAYYQLGLTYQIKGDGKMSYANFQKSIQLFTEIEAPKQIDKVKQSVQNSE